VVARRSFAADLNIKNSKEGELCIIIIIIIINFIIIIILINILRKKHFNVKTPDPAVLFVFETLF